jgi:long-chain acyl-CoA synthetase
MKPGGAMMTDSKAAGKPVRSHELPFETLPALFDHAVESYGSLVAMKCRHPWGYQSISYREMGRLVSYIGTGLLAGGLGKGDRVVLIADNSPEWTLLYAAVTCAGAIVVPLEVHMMENEIRHLLLHSGAHVLVTSPQIYNDRIEGMHLKNVRIIVIGEHEAGLGGTSLGEVMADGKERIGNGEGEFFKRKAAVSTHDPAAICYTSGTTGQPKGVVLTHRNLVSNVKACLERFSITEKDSFLCLLPLYHTFATTTDFLVPVARGCSITFARSLKSRDIRDDIERENITILVGVPLFFDHMISSIRERIEKASKGKRLLFRLISGVAAGIGKLVGKDVHGAIMRKKLSEGGMGSLRFCISGAAALRPDVEKGFFTIGLPILQGYGLTETSPVVAVNPLERPKKGTVGLPLKGVDVRIQHPDGDGVGEVTVRGDNIMKEYWSNPEATANVLRNGWLQTGDLGTIDRDGYLTIVGRKKDIIVTAGGKNIYPEEIEARLNRSPFILESMVLAVSDRKGNDRAAAVIVPDYDSIGSDEALKGDLTEQGIKNIISNEIERANTDLQAYKRIVDFQIRDEELPKTPTRKVKRHLVTWMRE